MHIKITLTEDIINECLTLHYGQQYAAKKLKQKLLWIPLILVIISAYLIYTELQQAELGQNFYMAMLYIAFAVGYYFFMRKRMLKAGKQLLKTLGSNSSFEMEVTEDALSTTTSHTSFNTSWSAFTHALISKNNVLLYQANDSFSMFNYRFFANDDFELFKSWIREKVTTFHEV